MRAFAGLIGISALLGGCAGVPPDVNPTVEVWDVDPIAAPDTAGAIIEGIVDHVFLLASSAVDDATRSDSGCLFWCSRGRETKSSFYAPPVAGPVVYGYTPYSEPPRRVTRTTNTASRPVQVAAPKPATPKEHAPRQTTYTPAAKPSTPKPPKPAASSASNKKTDKK